jgi:thiosulfate dehydrogenase [quinone] large subunit
MPNTASFPRDPWAATRLKLWVVFLLRITLGWQFFYEGFSRLLNPYWSSAGSLLESKGPLAAFFHSLASGPATLKAVDIFNTWGFIIIGLGLLVGFLSRTAAAAGMVLIFFHYLCNPPFLGTAYTSPQEGSYLFINKDVVEFFALWVLVLFPTGRTIGLGRLVSRKAKDV